ncbi:MAG TPA: ABC transporter permease [candidate division Zixibacteria bacterium]|jgi:tungstate transport system permease protein|nr:ABC transporter permease [candidate division Zixibacteria bacterium]
MFSLGQSLSQAFGMLARFDPEIWQIVLLSLRVSLSSSLIAACLAVPLSLAITQNQFPGKRAVIGAVNSFIAVPAVVIGLVCYLLLSRSGPLGFWRLLYTPWAMVIAQTLLVIPLMTGLSVAALQGLEPRVKETMITLGAGRRQLVAGIVREVRFPLTAAFITGFARVIGETGMTMMVGGNIKGDTRVMTTAIALETIKGNFELGIALGAILLFVAVGVNVVLQLVQGRAGR